MTNAIYVVRWDDKDGNAQNKSFETEARAKELKKLLIDNGVVSVDIAIKPKSQANMFPKN